MDFSTYILAVSLIAIFYSIAVRKIQDKFIDRKESEEIQKESKRLSAAYNEAIKKGDKEKADKIMQEQLALLSRMNKMMFAQLKPMLIIVVVFFAITTVIDFFNPYVQDDITILLTDDGKGCDKIAGDNVFTGCYTLANNSNEGKWVVLAFSYDNGREIASNSSFFYVNKKEDDHYLQPPRGSSMVVKTDKEEYASSETIVITAMPDQKATDAKAILDNGTTFKVELPFEIPLIIASIKTFYHPSSWFIFVSLLFGLLFSFVTGRFK